MAPELAQYALAWIAGNLDRASKDTNRDLDAYEQEMHDILEVWSETETDQTLDNLIEYLDCYDENNHFSGEN